MSSNKSLPVIMPDIPDQNWSCHSCGDCCRDLVGHLFPSDVDRIIEQKWHDLLAVEPYIYINRKPVLNKHEDGSCVFLNENNRCMIHEKFGESAKPVACRIFPFSARQTSNAWQMSFRYDCPSATSSKGAPIASHKSWVENVVDNIPSRSTIDAPVFITTKREATAQEIESIRSRFLIWIKNNDQPLIQRIIAAARLTYALNLMPIADTDEDDFLDLLSTLSKALPNEAREAPQQPSDKKSGLFRQFVFAHTEYVTLKDLQLGVIADMKNRKRQLSASKSFLKGKGKVPPIPGMKETCTFEDIEKVVPPTDDDKKIESLMKRYIEGRLQSDSVWGDGYYGFSILDGLDSLWLIIGVTGWLARYHAACENRNTFTMTDVEFGLRLADRAATRAPTLGSRAEKLRLSYMRKDSGIADLVFRYSPFENTILT